MDIEKQNLLYKKYGEAFAAINTVDYLLERLLDWNGNLRNLNLEIRDKILKGKTLGQKKELASSLMSSDLKGKITELNNRRTKLAHAQLTFVQYKNFVQNVEREYFAFTKDGKHTEVNVDFFDDIILNANEIIEDLRKLTSTTKLNIDQNFKTEKL